VLRAGLTGATYELGHEGNHEIEKTDGLDESETQNGVGEELATESRVAGNTVQESGEDETDTNTGTSQTNGGGTHTNVLGDLNHGLGDLGRVGTLLDLEGVAGGSLQELGSLLALEGLEGSGSACEGIESKQLIPDGLRMVSRSIGRPRRLNGASEQPRKKFAYQ
jgi:hypothetical protein